MIINILYTDYHIADILLAADTLLAFTLKSNTREYVLGQELTGGSVFVQVLVEQRRAGRTVRKLSFPFALVGPVPVLQTFLAANALRGYVGSAHANKFRDKSRVHYYYICKNVRHEGGRRISAVDGK